MAQVMLDRTGIVALVREIEACGMPQDVGMDGEGNPRLLPFPLDQFPERRRRQRPAKLRDEDLAA